MTATLEHPPVTMHKFRLLVGRHAEPVYDAAGNMSFNPDGTIVSKSFGPGEIIESPNDLAALHNVRGISRRFDKVGEETTPNQLPHEGKREYAERLMKLAEKAEADAKSEEATRQAVAAGELSAMTFEQLQRVAADEEIDIADCGDKEAAVERITSALGGKKVVKPKKAGK